MSGAAARRSIFMTALALCGLMAAAEAPASEQQEQEQQQQAPVPKTAAPDNSAPRTRYRINLTVDFDSRAYTGTELVSWTNEDDHPASVLYFHLYPNMRTTAATVQHNAAQPTGSSGGISSSTGAPGSDSADEPRLDVTEVRAAATGALLAFAVDDQGVTLRVSLRDPVAAWATTEVL